MTLSFSEPKSYLDGAHNNEEESPLACGLFSSFHFSFFSLSSHRGMIESSEVVFVYMERGGLVVSSYPQCKVLVWTTTIVTK